VASEYQRWYQLFLLHHHCEVVRKNFTRCRRAGWWWPGPAGLGDPTWEWPRRKPYGYLSKVTLIQLPGFGLRRIDQGQLFDRAMTR
jgi:hypothetical protein